MTGVLREHVLEPAGNTCSFEDEDRIVVHEGSHDVGGRGGEAQEIRRVGGGSGDKAEGDKDPGGRCWNKVFVVDIRYDTSTDQVL